MKTCKAAVFSGNGRDLEIKSFPIPKLRPGELLVQIEACTICGSDLHTIEGKREEKTPTILGHETIGTVIDSCGPVYDFNHHELNPGDRITWSVCISCCNCDRCQNGIPQKCRDLKKFGHEQISENVPLLGGFAERALLPAGAVSFKIPPEIESSTICPANCATATVLASMETAGQVQEKKVLILGSGMLGLTAGAYCSSRGAREILFVDRNEKRIELAKLFGASRVVTSLNGHLGARSEDDFDLVFDFSGSAGLIQEAATLMSVGGRLILAGTVMPGPEVAFNPESLVRKLNSIHGVHNYRPEHLSQAILFLSEQKDCYPFDRLVEKSFALDKINEGLEYAISRQPVRVMIKP